MRIFPTCIIVIAISSLTSGCGEGNPDPVQLASGEKVYLQHCASCHGAKLEGQPNWRAKLPNGRMPAPPHDDSGHTWHHPDEVLFGITKHGLVPPYAPPGYESDMPAFANTLTDEEIRAVLAYIASQWSPEVTKVRAEMIANVRNR
ncbi:MAG TPA: cytochrome c [Burkholderiales bacterium]|nr:cytochrome c [Burkholderiales bacterium]